MVYDINQGPLPQLREHRKPRGIKPAYPFRDMEIGQWTLVPIAEERRLFKAVKNAKYNLGIRLQVQQSADRLHWVVMRVPTHVPAPQVGTR
jgi:hypothetical protein